MSMTLSIALSILITLPKEMPRYTIEQCAVGERGQVSQCLAKSLLIAIGAYQYQ